MYGPGLDELEAAALLWELLLNKHNRRGDTCGTFDHGVVTARIFCAEHAKEAAQAWNVLATIEERFDKERTEYENEFMPAFLEIALDRYTKRSRTGITDQNRAGLLMQPDLAPAHIDLTMTNPGQTPAGNQGTASNSIVGNVPLLHVIVARSDWETTVKAYEDIQGAEEFALNFLKHIHPEFSESSRRLEDFDLEDLNDLEWQSGDDLQYHQIELERSSVVKTTFAPACNDESTGTDKTLLHVISATLEWGGPTTVNVFSNIEAAEAFAFDLLTRQHPAFEGTQRLAASFKMHELDSLEWDSSERVRYHALIARDTPFANDDKQAGTDVTSPISQMERAQ